MIWDVLPFFSLILEFGFLLDAKLRQEREKKSGMKIKKKLHSALPLAQKQPLYCRKGDNDNDNDKPRY